MKKIIYSFLLSISCIDVFAQVYTGSLEIDGQKKEGFYVQIKGSEESVLKAWKTYVKDFGAVEKDKNYVVLVSNVKIPSIDKKDLFFASKVYSENEKTRIFVSLQNSNKEVIKTGNEDYRAATNWLENFSNRFELEENVRLEQGKLEDILRNKTKIQRAGERLQRELEANKRQTDLLNKKLEETKLQKEKILTNQEQNKLDIQKIENEILQQTKQVEAAKQKIK